jgi:S-formylglutathione hydrolase FrmB
LGFLLASVLTCPFAEAKAFAEAKRQAGNRWELETHEGGRHRYLMFDEMLYSDALEKTERFLSSLNLLPKP